MSIAEILAIIITAVGVISAVGLMILQWDWNRTGEKRRIERERREAQDRQCAYEARMGLPHKEWSGE